MPKFGAAIDTQRIPILGLRPQQAANDAAITSPVEGLFYYDSTLKVVKVYLNNGWVTLGAAGAGGPPSGSAGGDLTGNYPNPTIGTGKVTSAHILDGTIALGDLSATGTKDATTYLRGDNTWAVVIAGATGTAGGDLTGTYPNPDIAPGAVDFTTINTALKPSGSAVDSAEALRALGFIAKQAMPGVTRLNGIPSPNANVDMNGFKITGLSGTFPSASTDAASKGYVDSVAQGLAVKTSVVLATTTNVVLSGTATQIDGVFPNDGDRVLVKDQSGAANNGIYIANSGGSWNRAPDMDTWAEVPSAFVFVSQGTVNADTGWVSTADPGGTLGGTAITWTQFSGAGSFVDGAGLVKSGNTLNVNTDNTTIEVNADALRVKAAGIGLSHLATGLTDGTAGSKQVRAIGTAATDAAAGNHAHDVTTTSITGILPYDKGGTGWSVDPVPGGVAYGGAAPSHSIRTSAAGTSGQLLASGAAAPPTWVNADKNLVGLGNVDNTSDANKPLSTAATTALANKAPLSHTHLIADLPVAPSGTSNTTQLVRADDARLSDTRTPTDGTVTLAKLAANSVDSSKIVDGSVAYVDLNADTKGLAAGTASLRALTGGTAVTGYASDTPLNLITAPAADVSLNSKKITGLLDPTNASDAATKQYVDAMVQGLDAKLSVRAASTTSIAGGGVPGNVQVIDGFTTGAGDRVLLKDQSNPQNNGIYITNTSITWNRVADMDNWAEVPGAFVFVEGGSTNADTGWVCTADVGGVIGTTAMPWTQFSSAGAVVAGTGMTQSGQTLNVIGTANRITANADNIDIASNYAGQNTITTVGGLTAGSIGGAFTAVPVANGGTGATDAATAIKNLGGGWTGSGNVPALTAGVWTTLTGTDASGGVITQFQEVAGGYQEILLDVRQNPGGVGEIQVKADIAYSAGALVYQWTKKAF